MICLLQSLHNLSLRGILDHLLVSLRRWWFVGRNLKNTERKRDISKQLVICISCIRLVECDMTMLGNWTFSLCSSYHYMLKFCRFHNTCTGYVPPPSSKHHDQGGKTNSLVADDGHLQVPWYMCNLGWSI